MDTTTGGEEGIRHIRGDSSPKDIPILLFSINDDIEKISKSLAVNGMCKNLLRVMNKRMKLTGKAKSIFQHILN